MKRIGVFSGTFDPFHVGHLESCLVAKSVCELDAIVILLEKNPHRKTAVTDYRHRLAMIDLATKKYPSLRLLDAEEDNITTKNSLSLLKNHFPGAEYWYILGSDMLKHIDAWPSAGELFKRFKLCIVLRANEDEAQTIERIHALQEQFGNFDYKILPEVWSEVSSSRVRDDIERSGSSSYVTEEVLGYIKQQGIY